MKDQGDSFEKDVILQKFFCNKVPKGLWRERNAWPVDKQISLTTPFWVGKKRLSLVSPSLPSPYHEQCHGSWKLRRKREACRDGKKENEKPYGRGQRLEGVGGPAYSGKVGLGCNDAWTRKVDEKEEGWGSGEEDEGKTKKGWEWGWFSGEVTYFEANLIHFEKDESREEGRDERLIVSSELNGLGPMVNERAWIFRGSGGIHRQGGNRVISFLVRR